MNKYGEPWKRSTVFPKSVIDRLGFLLLDAAGSNTEPLDRAKDCVNAIAGLEIGDVAKLVGLVRRYRAYHDVAHQGLHLNGECPCVLCTDARPLLVRLPK